MKNKVETCVHGVARQHCVVCNNPMEPFHSWETTPHMIRNQEIERNRATFDYGYNSKTGKIERL